MSLSASDYDDFTRIMALHKLYYLLTYLLTTERALEFGQYFIKLSQKNLMAYFTFFDHFV